MNIKQLKEHWLKAKIAAKDFRGLKANRFAFAETDAARMEIFFYSVFEGEKRELEMNIEETGDYDWNWKDFLKHVKEAEYPMLTINFSVNIWKKYDRETKHLFTINFQK